MELETCPLNNLHDLINWSAPELTVLPDSTPLSSGFERNKKNKVLFCHDMMGGYLDDKFHFGGETARYSFCYWHLIDVFVYFSHHFITIPPVNWIHCANKNSVPILGTFITEGQAGFQICQSILGSEAIMEVVVSQLVQIAKVYHLSGWLINIENSIISYHVPAVVKMLTVLNSNLQQVLSEPIVVWYDSIVKSGELNWQNELNNNNKVFLQGTGAYIFTNYWWTEGNLVSMSQRFGEFADRIFVGVDVFGRGVKVGGPGFEIEETVQTILKYDLSVALFAPGWTWEKFGSEEIYWDMEKLFWDILTKLVEERSYSLPFKSSFCRGFGTSTWNYGKKVGDSSWYQIGLQQPQLNSCQYFCENDPISVTFCDRLAYFGGNCLRFTIHDKITPIYKNILKLSVKGPKLCLICDYNVGKDFPYDLFFQIITESGDPQTCKVVQQFKVDDLWLRKKFLAFSSTSNVIVSILLVPNLKNYQRFQDHELLLGHLEIFEYDEVPPPLLVAPHCGYSVDYSLENYSDRFIIKFKNATNNDYFLIWREQDTSLVYIGRTFLPYFIVDSSEFTYLVEAIPNLIK